jgi:hypothetical protein
MIRTAIYTLLLALGLAACSGSGDKKVETDIDVANVFIRDMLDNKLKDAEGLVLPDEDNKQYFEVIRQQYSKKDAAELEKYKSSSIIINEVSPVNDSVSIVNYSNSYNKQDKNKLKMVRKEGKWLVDLKYTFSGNL